MINKSRKLIPSYLFIAFCFLFFSSTVFADTLSGYHKRVHLAKQTVDFLLYDNDDDSGVTKNAAVERESLKQIRYALPPTENIESVKINVEVQNKWLAEKLDDYEKGTDPLKRRAILGEISERLGALEAEIGELEKASAAARTKDEDKRKLTEILNRAEYQKPLPPEENFLQRSWRKFKEWLGSVFPKSSPFSIPEAGLKSISVILQFVIYALVLGIIGFLIYRFAPLLKAKFGKRLKSSRSDRVVLGETLNEDVDSQTLFTEAENLARQGNLKAAIRKGYIALLCDLSDRKIIGLAKNKTNRDYLRDVRSQEEIFRDMKNLTTSFEKHWYGFGKTQEEDWNDFREKYRTVSSKLLAVSR